MTVDDLLDTLSGVDEVANAPTNDSRAETSELDDDFENLLQMVDEHEPDEQPSLSPEDILSPEKTTLLDDSGLEDTEEPLEELPLPDLELVEIVESSSINETAQTKNSSEDSDSDDTAAGTKEDISEDEMEALMDLMDEEDDEEPEIELDTEAESDETSDHDNDIAATTDNESVDNEAVNNEIMDDETDDETSELLTEPESELMENNDLDDAISAEVPETVPTHNEEDDESKDQSVQSEQNLSPANDCSSDEQLADVTVPNEELLTVLHDLKELLIESKSAKEIESADTHYANAIQYAKNERYYSAAKSFRKASMRGHGKAQFYLGLLFLKGDGVPKSFFHAYIWLSLAINQGVEEAKGIREQLQPYLTARDINSALRIAAERFEQIENLLEK